MGLPKFLSFAGVGSKLGSPVVPFTLFVLLLGSLRN